MPDISVANLVSWCVVWQKEDTKTHYGQPRVNSPESIKCRWLVTNQAPPTQEETREAYSRSMLVARDIALGSFVWGPGRIEDLPDSPQYYEVIAIEKILDLKGRHPTYRVHLQKASKTLPTLVT